MNIQDINMKDLIPIIWDTKGKWLHDCGMRYRKAKPGEMQNVVNWATRDTFKRDAEHFARSSYASKSLQSRFVSEKEK